MKRISAFLVVFPWYLSWIIFWAREKVPVTAILSELFSFQTIVLKGALFVLAPILAICLISRAEHPKLHHPEKYLALSIVIALLLGYFASYLWYYISADGVLLSTVVILSWKFLLDYPLIKWGGF